MDKSRIKIKVLRAAVMILILLLILLLIVAVLRGMLPGFVEVLQEGSEESIQDYIRSQDSFKGMALAVLLQYMQILSIVFPGAPIQIAAGIIYGTWLGLLLCHIGYVSASCTVFLLSRRFSAALDRLLPKEAEKKKGGFILNSSQPELMVFLSSLLPVIPNGLVPYLASKTKMTFFQFFVSVWLGCIPCLLMLCAVGNRILNGEWLLAAIYAAVLLAAIGLLFWKRRSVAAFLLRLKNRRRGNNVDK